MKLPSLPMAKSRWQVSKGWVAIYVVTGVVIVVVGAFQSSVVAIVIGAVSIPFGIGVDAVLHRRRQRNKREPVRRV
jgi:hypothetical protein